MGRDGRSRKGCICLLAAGLLPALPPVARAGDDIRVAGRAIMTSPARIELDRQVRASYAMSMHLFQLINQDEPRPGTAYKLQEAAPCRAQFPWLWFGDDGSSLRRVSAGLFRISSASRNGDWFSDIDCRSADWPLFACEDGRMLRMAAPSPDRVTFGGVRYRRRMPGSETLSRW